MVCADLAGFPNWPSWQVPQTFWKPGKQCRFSVWQGWMILDSFIYLAEWSKLVSWHGEMSVYICALRFLSDTELNCRMFLLFCFLGFFLCKHALNGCVWTVMMHLAVLCHECGIFRMLCVYVELKNTFQGRSRGFALLRDVLSEMVPLTQIRPFLTYCRSIQL